MHILYNHRKEAVLQKNTCRTQKEKDLVFVNAMENSFQKSF